MAWIESVGLQNVIFEMNSKQVVHDADKEIHNSLVYGLILGNKQIVEFTLSTQASLSYMLLTQFHALNCITHTLITEMT